MGDVVYANSGSWLDGSHLVVHRDPASGRLVHVELRHWRNGGIIRVDAMDVPHPDLAPAAAVSGGPERLDVAAPEPEPLAEVPHAAEARAPS